MIQINPLKSYIDGGVRAALTTPPSASLVFDLPGKAIWVKGVKLKGTDHTYTFSHDNYITLTNTPDSNESEDIKIGVNTSALKSAIDTTYGVVSTTANGLAPKFTSGNKLAAAAATTYYFLGWAGSTLKWYQAPFRNVRINSETTDCLGVNNTDPLIIGSGNGISVTWDSTNKKIIITNTKPDVNHNTDYRVTQSETTTANYRPLVVGYTNVNTAGSGMTGNVTNQVYVSNKFYVQPSTGNLYATTFVGALLGNASSATKLQTARNLWGNSFNGTADISGTIKFNNVTSGLCEGILWTCGDNDFARIKAGATGSNAGYLEISTADDGNEPIYIRQYTGVFSSVKRTLTLLDANGYTHFPSYINIGGNENNNSSPDRVWGSNGSDSYLRSYRTSALRVAYASNSDTVDGIDSSGFLRYYNSNIAPSNVDIVNTPSYVWTVSTTGGSVANATKPSGMDNAWGVIHLHTHIGNYATQLGFGGTTNRMYMRNAYNTSTFGNWQALAFTTDNVASATKLQTSRTLWSQPFDGTSNVSGSLSGVGHIQFSADNSYNIGTITSEAAHTYTRQIWARHLNASRVYTGDTNLYIGYSNTAQVKFYSGTQQSGNGSNERMTILTNGNVGIGTTNPSSKLTINGVGNDQSPVQLVNASRNGTWVYNASFLAPNLTSNNNNAIFIGKAHNTRDAFGLTHMHIGDESSSNYAALEVWGVGNVLRWYYDRHSAFLHRTDFASLDSNVSYMSSALLIREHAYGGAQADSWANAPRLSWHWEGRVQTQIGLASNNELYLSKNNFGNAYKLMYETGTWGISITGNANSATNADKVDGYHASSFVKIKLFRFNQYNQGTWTKILTITINSTTDLLSVIAFSWIPSECNRDIWADFSISWRSNSPIFYAIWKGMNSRTLKVVNSSGAIWDVWVSGNKTAWDPYGEIQVTYTHNITFYDGGNLGYSDTDPGGTTCITGGQVNYASSATTSTYATNSTYLYASDSPYRYGDSAPYYMKMRYNVNNDNRWYLSAYPETPKTVAVDYSYVSGNADTVDGLHVHSGRNNEANKIVRTDANGYILAGWINTTSGDMGTTAATRVYCSNDAYIRYKTISNFRTDLVSGLYWANIKISTSSSTSTNPTFASLFINTGDPTLKVYSGRITDAKSDGNMCLQTSIDGTDGQSHTYPTQYGARCNLVLLPRGGLVYIGTNPDGGNTAYKLYVNGSVYASSFTGNVIGNASSASTATKLASSGYANNALSYYQTDQAFDGSATGWAHYIIANHHDGASYYHYTIRLPFWDVPQYRRLTGSTSNVTSWYNFITAENIGSQSVNYATSAGNADTTDGLHLYTRNLGINGTNWTFASTANANSTTHIYAATSAGTSGQILKSTGGTPTWINQSDISAGYATYLNVQYCRDDGSPSNKGLWNTIKNGTTNAITDRVRFYTIYGTSAALGAPDTYGELLEICSYNTNHWQPLLWFGSGKNGRLYYRNKNYNDNSWGSWRTVAWTSEIPTVTDYYWANVKISASSSTSTSPTFSTCYSNNWFRSTGLTGWYNETYSGGWYMNDTTWIRTWNSKGIYTSSGTIYNAGHAWFATNSGYNVGIGTTSPSYKLHVVGDSYTSIWSRAGSGFYCEGTGVHFTRNSSAISAGEIDMTSNNEFCWGSSNGSLYFNYRGASRGKTVTNYIWNAGSSSSYASHTMGHITLGGSSYLLKRVGYSVSWINGRDSAIVRQTSANGYSVVVSSKTINGSWEIGNYSGNAGSLYFTYITDSNYNSKNNVFSGQLYFSSDGSIYASHFYEKSDIRYKKILKNLSINSNIIANLPLFDFEWIENNTIGTGTSALAVLQILPNIVSGTDKLTLNYGVLGTIAGITACKELVTLKSELLQLKEKVKLLEDKLRKYENI